MVQESLFQKEINEKAEHENGFESYVQNCFEQSDGEDYDNDDEDYSEDEDEEESDDEDDDDDDEEYY